MYWVHRAKAAELKVTLLRFALERHHDHALQECNVYFEQDGNPIDVCTDLGAAYAESQLAEQTIEALKI